MRSIYYPNQMYSVSHKLSGCLKWFLSVLILMGLLLETVDLHAAFNQHEIKLITENIEERFKLLIDTWNEELYFEMYDFGQRASHQRISRGEFAQRMVELKWKPTLAPIEIDKIDILYLNYAVIYFWQEFENKVNVLSKVKKYMIFPVILENNIWQFNLTQLIQIPYEGKFKKPQALVEKLKTAQPETSVGPDGAANPDTTEQVPANP